MTKPFLIFLVSALIILCGGCNKPGPDSTAIWEGSYKAAQTYDTLNSIIITNSGNNLIRVEIKAISANYIYVYTTLQHVAVTNMTQAVINENENLTGSNGPYHIQGYLTLSGRTLTLVATATSGSDVKQLNFTGDKVH